MICSQQLLHEGTCEIDFFEPKIPNQYIERVHSPEYLKRLLTLQLNKKETEKLGFH